MKHRLLISFIALIFYTFSSTTEARDFCWKILSGHSVKITKELFEPQTPPPPRQTSRTLNDFNRGIYREPDLLLDLIKSRKYPLLKAPLKNGDRIFWFLSVSRNGRLYQVNVKQDPQGKIIDKWALKPEANIEKIYYRRVAEKLQIEDFHGNIKLPRKGNRELIIPSHILVKLELKHNLTIDDIIPILRRVPQNIKYEPNNTADRVPGDSFMFFVDVGMKMPLKVVITYKDNTYILMTAFFPNTFHPR